VKLRQCGKRESESERARSNPNLVLIEFGDPWLPLRVHDQRSQDHLVVLLFLRLSSFLPSFHTRSIDCSLSVCLSLLQMTTSGSHLTSVLRQTKPNQNPDKTKNGSSGHKSHMQILCGNAAPFHQPQNVSSHTPLSLQRSSATKPTTQTRSRKFRFRCDAMR
jgi:hypothetical protein